MNIEIIARIDAWLESRRADPEWKRQASMLESRRWNIIGSWNGVASRLRTWPGDPGEQAAAAGILLALVREAWNDPHLSTEWTGPSWEGLNDGWGLAGPTALCCGIGIFPTEDDALVAALESAPR